MGPSQLSGLILAGGKSSRMGQDKALLKVGATTLLERVCRVAQGVADPVVVITPWPERYRALLPQGCQVWREDSDGDLGVGQGPLLGFAQGLAQVTTPWVLLLACDLPRLETTVLLSWRSHLDQVPPGAIALLPKGKGGWEPLCGFYRRRCLGSLLTYLGGGGRSFQGWLGGEVVQPLGGWDSPMLFNCNTPEDYAQLFGPSGDPLQWQTLPLT